MAEADKCYSVSQITRLIRSMLEDEFVNITIEGEISNFRPSSTGHYYFSLKDKEAIISVVMFKNRQLRLNFMPADGILVRAAGNISVYAKRGNYQLICESLTRSGEGDILARLEERKRELAAMGFFDSDRKKSLPLFPSTVAVVTSPTGAAIRDILRVLTRRNAGINLIVLPAPVQGETAAEIIAAQIRTANSYTMAEVIIITRGGGSLEDLLPFYDESVVKAIADSAIPVISAIGHEIDITLSDLAADMRAPTPSAAAEMVTASRVDLSRRVQELKALLLNLMSGRLEKIDLLISQYSAENLEHNFGIFFQSFWQKYDEIREELLLTVKNKMMQIKHRLELIKGELAGHSPMDTLKRGYAVVVHRHTGEVLLSAEKVKYDDELKIRLYKGGLTAGVKEIMPDEEL